MADSVHVRISKRRAAGSQTSVGDESLFQSARVNDLKKDPIQRTGKNSTDGVCGILGSGKTALSCQERADSLVEKESRERAGDDDEQSAECQFGKTDHHETPSVMGAIPPRGRQRTRTGKRFQRMLKAANLHDVEIRKGRAVRQQTSAARGFFADPRCRSVKKPPEGPDPCETSCVEQHDLGAGDEESDARTRQAGEAVDEVANASIGKPHGNEHQERNANDVEIALHDGTFLEMDSRRDHGKGLWAGD